MEQMEAGQQQMYEFTVYVVKPDIKTAMVYEISTVDAEISIQNIMILKYEQDIEELWSNKYTNYADRPEYLGPDFHTLDEKLQKYLLEYLKEQDFGEELVTFVETYTMDREQRLYMEWLQAVFHIITY